MAGITKIKQLYDSWVVDNVGMLSSFENFMKYSLYLVPFTTGPGQSTVEGGTTCHAPRDRLPLISRLIDAMTMAMTMTMAM
jgi:hypothetical protein